MKGNFSMNKPHLSAKKIVFLTGLTFLFIGVFIHFFIFRTAIVDGHSMTPTVNHNETIIYNRLSYLFDSPKRGDVVVIMRDDQTYIKRIIGLPNETLSYKDQQLYIDDIAYRQTFITNKSSFWTHDISPIYIPDNHYYVMGDNRPNSRDSRNSLGFILRDEVIGRAEIVIYPFDHWQVIY